MASRILISLLLAFACCFSSLCAETRKELRTKEMNQGTIIQMGHLSQSNRFDPSRVIQLSWQPRVFSYNSFLSDEECDHLIYLARGEKENSGKVGTDRLPTNLDISLNTEDEIVARIEERISAWTFLPKDNSNSLQVLQFGFEEAKQKYNYFGNKSTLVFSKPLMATVILYLSNVTQGGHILFSESEVENSQPKNKIWSDCSKTSNTPKPTKGNAILFFNLHLNATLDNSSSHVRCPVLEGEMWCATKFFYMKPISGKKFQSQSEGGNCTDEDENCPWWASTGECQRNPVFMIGSPDYYGTCMKSCEAC